MPCKHLVQAVRLFQRAAQGVEVFLVGVLHAGAAQTVHPRLIFCQFVLVAEHRSHILRGRQNTPHDGFAQGHFRRDAAVEQFLGHVAVVVEIADIGGGQPQKFCVRAECQKFLYPFAPVFCARPVKFVHNNVGRVQRSDLRQLFLCTKQQLCVGVKADVFQRKIWFLFLQAFQLGLENVLTGRQPQKNRLRVVLDQLEGYVALASAGGMDHGRLAVSRQHSRSGTICLRIMFK